MKIGIFDSGMGGLSVLATAKDLIPNADFIYYGDSINAPYGIKTKSEVIKLSIDICDILLSKNVDAIVVACNTATSAAISVLREKYDIPIIGMEPALKPAIESNKGGDIVVMATPMTLKEEKFKHLLSRLNTGQIVYEIPAPKIVNLVESGVVDGVEMEEVINDYFDKLNRNNIESIVLGCTHFLFITNLIKRMFPEVNLFDGNRGTINQLIRRLPIEKGQNSKSQNIVFLNSGGEELVLLSKKLLKDYEDCYGN